MKLWHRLPYAYDSILFFFSSRRRHTRCSRDWSSDVCSSDLSVRLVVADEWHELLGNKRGVQLQLALARLRGWSPQLSVWGMSATLGNLDEAIQTRSEEHTSELQSRLHLVCRLLLEKKKKTKQRLSQ